ncbi:hypothetical protein Q3V30_04770 [Erwinia pyri]|uniref:Type III secretion system protein n=1 Tax=Erwinia pyri TaxID=3062598 RepID=A0AA50HP16_9GAMM|nr:hypothetical protein [Erwinia sp. DE2]WLS79822.1 hypothetical protein Q3V30_04770 [Erwinia sp. DE2]
MNMRVNPGGMMNQAPDGMLASRFTLKQEGKNGETGFGPASGKSTPLQYGGTSGTTSEKSSASSLLSDYKTLLDSLIKQGQDELKKLKDELAQQQSQSGAENSPATTESSNQMSQLQMLLDSLMKFLKESQQSQQGQQPAANSTSSDAQLTAMMTQLKDLLSTIGETSATGAATTGSESTGPAMPTDEKDTSVPPSTDTLFKNMDGDNRSADEIINDNPVLKNLGNQKDIKQEDLKKQFGDWTANNPDEKSRALAAKNMSYFLNNVKALDNREGGDRGDISTNGKIEGLTKSGDARHGTEAAIVKDVAEQGLDKMFPKDGRLTQTKDEMVNLNGTNKSGFQGLCLKVGRALAFIPGLSNFLTGMGRSESTNPWEVLKGGVVGAAKTAFDALKGVVEGLGKGRLNPIQMLLSAYKGAVSNTYVMQDAKSDVKDKVKETV